MRYISVAARESPLSCAQTQEVLNELKITYPDIEFELKMIKTSGDLDLTTSLREMDKTDFFTREIDRMILQGQCRAAIHSAKDLPDPLPKGLYIAAVTRGIDSSDSLVLKEGETLNSLPEGAVIATSSVRREDAVKSLRADFAFVDIRGTIEERLKTIEQGAADGVVIAESALIRLKLTHLNRITLPGETAPLQGRLAVVVRDDDYEMKEIFSCLCARSTQG